MPGLKAVLPLLALGALVTTARADTPGGDGVRDHLSLPHHEQLAPGVHAAGFSARHDSANCGWIEMERETLLVDVPRGTDVLDFLTQVVASTGKPVRTLALTHMGNADGTIIEALVKRGVKRILASPATCRELIASKSVDPTVELRTRRSYERRRCHGPSRVSTI